MTGHPFVLADAVRTGQFDLLARGGGLFDASEFTVDAAGIGWSVAGAAGVALTWLGPGRAFGSDADDDGGRDRAAMAGATPERHRQELATAAGRLRTTGRVTRLLWVVHRRVLAARGSAAEVPDTDFAGAVWGADRRQWPQNWRAGLFALLGPLTRVHLFDPGDAGVRLGRETALLDAVEDLRGAADDACPPGCPAAGRRHSHVMVHVGKGFLGVLERFAGPHSDDGGRAYSFPIASRRRDVPSLRRVGKTGRLVSVYLPAELAHRDPLADGQRRLLRAAVREATRAGPDAEHADGLLLVTGGHVPDAAGRRSGRCPVLSAESRYVAFGGNGVRRGLGYKLTTPGGWLAKAGHPAGDVDGFLAAAAGLAARLGLTVAGLDPETGGWHDLPTLRAFVVSGPGRRVLGRVHLRIYAPADFVARWNGPFGWDASPTESTPEDSTIRVARAIADAGLSRRAAAVAVGADPSFFSKVLSGKKPWPPGMAERALDRLSVAAAAPTGSPKRPTDPAPGRGQTQGLAAALEYRARGWSVVPVRAGEKRPCVRWKEFQGRVAGEDELAAWFRRWPDAGLALVLGPVSGVLAVDVDGPAAHAALAGRLGGEPAAPKTLSGSRKPGRYHLLFADPGFATKAKATPWHGELEFRGRGGLVVLPPSVHPSGHRYEWAAGRTPDELPLPPLPEPLRAALAPADASRPPFNRTTGATAPVPAAQAGEVGPSTARFLAGEYADGPNWNDRLFAAACDMAGRGVPAAEAEERLLDGAAPRDPDEAEAARRTVRSAYSRARTAGRS